jgi:hypothetical protein
MQDDVLGFAPLVFRAVATEKARQGYAATAWRRPSLVDQDEAPLFELCEKLFGGNLRKADL